MKAKFFSWNLVFIFLLFVSNFLFQVWALPFQVVPRTDEGVYLYQSKLITQGLVPYKDFAMTSHVPFLMYMNALILKLVAFNIFLYHYVYVFWVFLTVFPIFYTVLYFTKSRLASIFSVIIFSVFSEFAQWDAHSFAVRQASFPFLAFFIYFFFVAKKERLSQIFLVLFSFCLITNFLISLAFVLILFFYRCIKYRKNIGKYMRQYFSIYWVFVVSTFLYFGSVLLIPGSVYNLLAVQSHYFSFFERLMVLKGMMQLNWPIFCFGILGIFFLIKDYFLLSILAILTLSISLFASGSFFPHYLVLIAVPFSIMGGIFFNKAFLILSFYKKGVGLIRNFILFGMLSFSLYALIHFYLFKVVVLEATPDFFEIVDVLKSSPNPLFTAEPIYALYADRDITMHYNAAEMRVFGDTGTNLSEEEYENIVDRSNTILLDSFTDSMLPERVKERVFKDYSLVYFNDWGRVYIKKKGV